METKTWMSWFIIVIMIASTLGFVISMSSGDTTTIHYHGYTFRQGMDGWWITTIDDQQVAFSTVPDQLEGIVVPADALSLLKGTRSLAVTYDAESIDAESFALIQYEFATSMMQLRGQEMYVFPALINAGNYSLPEMSCANASATTPVLLLEAGSNTTEVFRDGNCVIARSPSASSLLPVSDRLVYLLVGVMDA